MLSIICLSKQVILNLSFTSILLGKKKKRYSRTQDYVSFVENKHLLKGKPVDFEIDMQLFICFAYVRFQ